MSLETFWASSRLSSTSFCGKQPRILFATQASTRPPRFVIFATGFLEHGYRRYIERCLREEFGFEATPIQISVNIREKKKRK